MKITNFQLNAPRSYKLTTYPSTSRSYVSAAYDAGQTVTWNQIAWSQNLPAGTSLKFQIAVSASLGRPPSFVGPDGTSSTDFTTSKTYQVHADWTSGNVYAITDSTEGKG